MVLFRIQVEFLVNPCVGINNKKVWRRDYMKKIFILLAMIMAIMFVMPQQTSVVEAKCPLIPDPGTIEVLATNRTYKVGEAFKTENIGIFVYGDRGRYKYYGHKQLKYWANGVPISAGYRFKQPGKKNITVKYKDKQANYEIQVFPADFRSNVRDCYVSAGNLNRTYRQNLDKFNPSDIVVHCVFTDGSSRNFRSSDLEFFANGNRITKGYRFKEAGQKKFIIRLGNRDMEHTLTVTPTFQKAVMRYELISWPEQTIYEVGEGFHTCEYTVRCYFQDGTVKDYSGDQLDITANGTQMYENYAFITPGEKKMVVSLGDFKERSTIAVVR